MDAYHQDLHKLFYLAYSGAQRCGGEAKAMGKSVLAYQFVAGFNSDLKAKLVGCEGDFWELLAKAQFEEARIRELAPARKQVQQESCGAKKSLEMSRQKLQSGGVQRVVRTDNTCFTCGAKDILLANVLSKDAVLRLSPGGRLHGYSGSGSKKTEHQGEVSMLQVAAGTDGGQQKR